jgi:hypothetical protein
MTDPNKPDADAIRADAKGQFAPTEAEPNPNGRVSANPTVLSGDGDATFDHTGEVERRAHGGVAATAWGDREPAGVTPKPQR